MKGLRIIFLLLISSQIFGQISPSSPTSSFTVKGKVKKEKSITLEDLKKYPNQILNNVNTSCSPKCFSASKLELITQALQPA